MSARIEAAVSAASKWADIEGVVMVAQGRSGDNDCIELHLSGRRADLPATIPDIFMGFHVVVIENVEEIKPH